MRRLAVAAAMLLFLGFIPAVVCKIQTADRGVMLDGVHEVHPAHLPWEVRVSSEVPLVEVRNAIRFWGQQTGRRDLFESPIVADIETDQFGDPKPVWGAILIMHANMAEDATTAPYQVRGQWTLIANVVSINQRLGADVYQDVMRHELGHCLGLEDDDVSPDSRSIMQRVLFRHGIVTPEDRHRIRRLETGDIFW